MQIHLLSLIKIILCRPPHDTNIRQSEVDVNITVLDDKLEDNFTSTIDKTSLRNPEFEKKLIFDSKKQKSAVNKDLQSGPSESYAAKIADYVDSTTSVAPRKKASYNREIKLPSTENEIMKPNTFDVSKVINLEPKTNQNKDLLNSSTIKNSIEILKTTTTENPVLSITTKELKLKKYKLNKENDSVKSEENKETRQIYSINIKNPVGLKSQLQTVKKFNDSDSKFNIENESPKGLFDRNMNPLNLEERKNKSTDIVDHNETELSSKEHIYKIKQSKTNLTDIKIPKESNDYPDFTDNEFDDDIIIVPAIINATPSSEPNKTANEKNNITESISPNLQSDKNSSPTNFFAKLLKENRKLKDKHLVEKPKNINNPGNGINTQVGLSGLTIGGGTLLAGGINPVLVGAGSVVGLSGINGVVPVADTDGVMYGNDYYERLEQNYDDTKDIKGFKKKEDFKTEDDQIFDNADPHEDILKPKSKEVDSKDNSNKPNEQNIDTNKVNKDKKNPKFAQEKNKNHEMYRKSEKERISKIRKAKVDQNKLIDVETVDYNVYENKCTELEILDSKNSLCYENQAPTLTDKQIIGLSLSIFIVFGIFCLLFYICKHVKKRKPRKFFTSKECLEF